MQERGSTRTVPFRASQRHAASLEFAELGKRRRRHHVRFGISRVQPHAGLGGSQRIGRPLQRHESRRPYSVVGGCHIAACDQVIDDGEGLLGALYL
jgi:hypothetical protein